MNDSVKLPTRVDHPDPVDGDVEPWSIEEIEIRTRTIGRRLMQINREQVRNNDEWSQAKADLTGPRQKRIVEIYRAEPKLPRWMCEAQADAELTDEAAVAFAWERIVRSNNDEARNLQSLLSSMQTIYNRLCQQAGHFKGGR